MAVPEWQVTAMSIYCDAVDDNVVLLVYKDGAAKWVGYKKYGENITKETAKELKNKSKKLGRELKCEGPVDHRVTEYRDKLLAEEEARAKS